MIQNIDWKVASVSCIIGIILGLLLMWAWQRGSVVVPEASADPSPEQSYTDEDGADVVHEANVAVSDQPAGRAVVVESATLPELGWIAVREVKDGKPGNVLGAVRRDAGTSNQVVVDLLRNTEPDGAYEIVLYTDDGDKTFELSEDTLLPGASPFTATLPLSPSGD